MTTANPFREMPKPKTEIDQSKPIPKIPYEIAPLPSRGKIYDIQHPLCNAQSVEIYALSPTEEDILNSPALLKNGTFLDLLMKSCLVNKLIDPTTLLEADQQSILTAIRISGYGKECSVDRVICKVCPKSFKHVFDLSKIIMKTLDVEPVQPNTNLFEFVLPKSGKKVLFSLFTGADSEMISKMQENRKKAKLKALGANADTSIIEHTTTDRLLQCLKEIDGNMSKQHIADFVMNRGMSAYDSNALRKYIEAIEPDIIIENEVTCPHCLETDIYRLPFTLNFFWP